MLDGYMEAEIVAARVGAAKMAVLECADASAFDEPDPDNPFRMEANAGMIEAIPPGYTLKEFKPDHPSNAFDQFVKTNLRWVASGLGLQLQRARQRSEWCELFLAALRPADRARSLESSAEALAEDFMQPIFEEWMKMALLTGALKLDSRDPERYRDGKWIPRGWQWVDPFKETQAAVMGIAAALQTRDQVIADRGGDYEEVFEQLAEEDKVAKEFGIDLVADIAAKVSTQNNPAAVDDEAEPSENPGADKEESEPTGKGGRSRLEVM